MKTYLDNIDSKIITSKKKIIRTYVTKNLYPNPKKVPNITIYWKLVHGGKAMNVLTNEITDVAPDFRNEGRDLRNYRMTVTGNYRNNDSKDIIITFPQKVVRATFANCFYNKNGIKGIEIAVIHINAERHHKTIRKWEYDDCRFFIFSDSPAVYDIYGELAFKEDKGLYYSKLFVDFCKKILVKTFSHNKFNQEVAVFTGLNKPVGNWYSFWNGWDFIEYYKNFTARPINSKNTDITELVNNLPDRLEEILDKYKIPPRYLGKSTTFAFEIVNDNYCVIRQYGGYGNTVEQARILISDKGNIRIFTPRSYEGENIFRISSCFTVDRSLEKKCFMDGFEKMSAFKGLRYITDMLDDPEFSHPNTVECIVDILRHPYLEKFYKAGYKALAGTFNHIAPTAFSKAFNVPTNSKKGIYEITKCNKYQLNLLESISQTYVTKNAAPIIPILKTVKFVTGTEQLSSLSNKDSKYYFNITYTYLNSSNHYSYERLLYREDATGVISIPISDWDSRWYMRGRTYQTDETDVKNLKKLFKLQSKENNNVFALFIDTLRVYKSLDKENRPYIDLYSAQSFNELHRWHDMLVDIKNDIELKQRAKQNKELDEKNQKYVEKRKEKFEYENDEFAIVVPEKVTQISEEGARLHHCVGSYVSSVAGGSTNILFLRKKNDIKSSFYTIEVNNEDLVVQIHGSYNRWLGNNPEAIPFVVDWIRKKGLRCKAEKVLGNSQGYGYSSSVSEEIFDAKAYGLEVGKYV